MAILKIARMGHPVLGTPAAAVDDPTAPRDPASGRRHDRDHGGRARRRAGGTPGARFLAGGRLSRARAPSGGEGAPPPLTILVNPLVEPLGEEMALDWEACLSLPGLTGVVPRHTRIRYRGVTPAGETVERTASGFHARVVQHECDHLDGVLYPQRMTDLASFGFADEMRNRLPGEPEPDDL